MNLLEKINKEVKPKMMAEFHLKNVNMMPSVAKVVVNVGLRSDLKDPKVVDNYIVDLAAITGQTPVKTSAKKSISAFKIRSGQVNGLMVTLRGRRMHYFLQKLLNVTLPRVRDFRGLEERGFDERGNFSLGFRDQIAFPEISADSVSHPFGLQVTIVMAENKPELNKAFLKYLGLPIKK